MTIEQDDDARARELEVLRVAEIEACMAIRIEKMICRRLGKVWEPTGMSIETLLDELQMKAPPRDRDRVRLSHPDDKLPYMQIADIKRGKVYDVQERKDGGFVKVNGYWFSSTFFKAVP